MKKIFALPVFVVAAIQLQAQNVGIGTNIPQAQLHVKRNTSIDANYSAVQIQGSNYSSYFHLEADVQTSINRGKATSAVFVNPQSTGGVYLSPAGGGVVIRQSHGLNRRA
jgi:hypothetical protein